MRIDNSLLFSVSASYAESFAITVNVPVVVVPVNCTVT